MKNAIKKANEQINKIVEDLEDKFEIEINLTNAIPNVDKDSGRATNRYKLIGTIQ